MSAPQNNKPGTVSFPAPQAPVYEVKALFGASKEILIRHTGEVYRLRITRQNKLILTK